MKTDKRQMWLDIILLVLGLFFLAMGCAELGEDDFGAILGFGMGLPMLGAFIWRLIGRKKGSFAPAGWLCILLFAVALFFLVMGVSSLGDDAAGASLGLVFGLALAALYVLRRREELRKARAAGAERQAPVQVQNMTANAEPARQNRAPQAPRQEALTICPHCGAPCKEKICPYCGMEKG